MHKFIVVCALLSSLGVGCLQGMSAEDMADEQKVAEKRKFVPEQVDVKRRKNELALRIAQEKNSPNVPDLPVGRRAGKRKELAAPLVPKALDFDKVSAKRNHPEIAKPAAPSSSDEEDQGDDGLFSLAEFRKFTLDDQDDDLPAFVSISMLEQRPGASRNFLAD